MFISPLDDDDVLSPISDDVPAFIVVLSFVLELNFIAGSFGAVDADVEDVITLTKEGKLNFGFHYILKPQQQK